MARSRKASVAQRPTSAVLGAPLASAQRKRASPKSPEPAEPDLVMLLGEPAVRLLMRADDGDEPELMAMLDAVSAQLRAGPADSKSEPSRSAAEEALYRAGVGIVLLNERSEVFVGRRADVPADAWQMPQGGIDDGESPCQPALRELREEIGTTNVEVLAESRGWLYYDLPEDLARKACRRRWKGQRQKWFAMLFRGDDAEIKVGTEHPEFNAWRWVSVQELIDLAVPFKRQLYLNVLGEFATIFRD
jgi:putative (di)nucleoside polyphosphate hydrolase